MADKDENTEFDAVKAQAAQVGAELKKLGNRLGALGAKTVRSAGATMSNTAQSARAGAADMAGKAESFTKDHPRAALGMAVAAGFVARAVLRRR